MNLQDKITLYSRQIAENKELLKTECMTKRMRECMKNTTRLMEYRLNDLVLDLLEAELKGK